MSNGEDVSDATTSDATTAAAATGGSLHTQTIAAPLHFAGNDPPLAGEISARDFLRELEVRILGQNITSDKLKLQFALNALQGKAHEWWTSLSIREDFRSDYAYFKKKFAHKYRVPGFTQHEFDFSLIARQKPEEDPTQYIARITAYLNNAAPSDSFIQWSPARRDEFNTVFAEKFQEQNRAARALCRGVVEQFGKLWAADIHKFHIKHIWLNGLLSPYADIAKAQDHDKELGALVDKVHDVGAAKLKRANFPDHLSAMRAFKNHHPQTVNAVSQHSGRPPRANPPQQPQSHDNPSVSVSALSRPPATPINQSASSKFCNYCKKKGHVITECHKRARRNASSNQTSTNNPSAPSTLRLPPPRSAAAPAQKAAMENLFRQWCTMVETQNLPPMAQQEAEKHHTQTTDFF